MDLPGGFGTGFLRGGEEHFPVVFIRENGLAPVTPVHEVMNRARIFNAQLPCANRALQIGLGTSLVAVVRSLTPI
jgi:hypothetical protein